MYRVIPPGRLREDRLTARRHIRVGICAWADPALIEDGSFYPREVDDGRGPPALLRERLRRGGGQRLLLRDPRRPHHGALGGAHAAGLRLPRQGLRAHDRSPRPDSRPCPRRCAPSCPRRPRLTPRGDVEAASLPAEALDAAFALFRAAVRPLAEAGKLGYVLFQFAPWVHYGTAGLDALAALPARLPGLTRGRGVPPSLRGFPSTPTRRCAPCASSVSPT